MMMNLDRIGGLLSYARALKTLIARQDFEIDDLRFVRRTDIVIPPDYVRTGRHTLVYELAGTGKQYRVMIEPIPETHRASP